MNTTFTRSAHSSANSPPREGDALRLGQLIRFQCRQHKPSVRVAILALRTHHRLSISQPRERLRSTTLTPYSTPAAVSSRTTAPARLGDYLQGNIGMVGYGGRCCWSGSFRRATERAIMRRKGLCQRLAPKTLERRTHWLAAAHDAGRDARRRAATAKARARLSSASHASPLLSLGVAELSFL